MIDKGTWSVFHTDTNVIVMSDDAEHDVILYIDGDFNGLRSKTEYAEDLCHRLNYEKNDK